MLEEEKVKNYIKNNVENFKNIDFNIKSMTLEYDNTFLVEVELFDNSFKYVRIPQLKEL